MASVTRVPFTDLRSVSSSPRSSLESLRRSVGGMRFCFRCEKIKSMLIPEYSNLMMGTNDSCTGLTSVMAPSGVISRSRSGKYLKKSIRDTCLGATTRVSMSEPGPNTPSRKLPKVKTLPPAEFATTSDKPCSLQTFFTKASTILCSEVRTAVLPDEMFVSKRRRTWEGLTPPSTDKCRVDCANRTNELPLFCVFFALIIVLSPKFLDKSTAGLILRFRRERGRERRSDSQLLRLRSSHVVVPLPGRLRAQWEAVAILPPGGVVVVELSKDSKVKLDDCYSGGWMEGLRQKGLFLNLSAAYMNDRIMSKLTMIKVNSIRNF